MAMVAGDSCQTQQRQMTRLAQGFGLGECLGRGHGLSQQCGLMDHQYDQRETDEVQQQSGDDLAGSAAHIQPRRDRRPAAAGEHSRHEGENDTEPDRHRVTDSDADRGGCDTAEAHLTFSTDIDQSCAVGDGESGGDEHDDGRIVQ